jgi:hypothetical protein
MRTPAAKDTDGIVGAAAVAVLDRDQGAAAVRACASLATPARRHADGRLIPIKPSSVIQR